VTQTDGLITTAVRKQGSAHNFPASVNTNIGIPTEIKAHITTQIDDR